LVDLTGIAEIVVERYTQTPGRCVEGNFIIPTGTKSAFLLCGNRRKIKIYTAPQHTVHETDKAALR
jgi:fructosamine-3-kinase